MTVDARIVAQLPEHQSRGRVAKHQSLAGEVTVRRPQQLLGFDPRAPGQLDEVLPRVGLGGFRFRDFRRLRKRWRGPDAHVVDPHSAPRGPQQEAQIQGLGIRGRVKPHGHGLPTLRGREAFQTSHAAVVFGRDRIAERERPRGFDLGGDLVITVRLYGDGSAAERRQPRVVGRFFQVEGGLAVANMVVHDFAVPFAGALGTLIVEPPALHARLEGAVGQEVVAVGGMAGYRP